MKTFKYILKTYNAQGEETFEIPIYIEESNCYRTVILKMVDQLRDLNLDIKADSLRFILGKNSNPSELYVTLERENDGKQ